MCGRYDYRPKEFADLRIRWNLDRDLPLFKPRYNIAPSQEAPVVVDMDGARSCRLFQWGLVPSWTKDPSIGNTMINARAETLADKPSFKRLLGKRHCLVLASGFYEWRREGKQKVPMRFKLKSGEPSLSRVCGIHGKNPTVTRCSPIRSSPRSPMRCCAPSITECRLCSGTMMR